MQSFLPSLVAILAIALQTSASLAAGNITAVWANEGGDKVLLHELRATGHPAAVTNSAWDGATIKLFGARNEVVSFNVVMEAAGAGVANANVALSPLTGPGGAVIRSAQRPVSDLFNWTSTDCELFYVRYLRITGMSKLSYGALAAWQEATFPEKMRLPAGGSSWLSRPGAEKYYPEIALPLERLPNGFGILAGNNQSVWADIYIPRTATAGVYRGTVTVSEAGAAPIAVPVALTVRNFELPDMPTSKTMVATGLGDIARRYTGVPYPNPGTREDLLSRHVLTRELLLAHRHKISLIDDNAGQGFAQDQPDPLWLPALSGALFTLANGYAGPGAGTGNNVFSIGTYGSWQNGTWQATQLSMNAHTDAWETWFENHSPGTERFVYLIDESPNYAQTQTWANWMATNPGPGHKLASLATLPLLDAAPSVPSLGIPTSAVPFGDTPRMQAAFDALHAAGKKVFLYASVRPGEGSMATEDEGTSPRELPWGQYKKGIDRWFIWEATYYNNYQDGLTPSDTNLFRTAMTFGGARAPDPLYGLEGWNSSNGDGVLFYPGMDALYPTLSLGIAGPMASLRLKHWRRGIQDVDYLKLAAAVNPAAVAALVSKMAPRAIWENPCFATSDCSYTYDPVSWSTKPDDWEAARAQLAHIIDGR